MQLIQQIFIWMIPILFAITLHEAAHGYVARYFGDDTAYLLGRITLNPLKHIDLFGTIILPIILMLTTSFLFGWAKPVPVNPSRLRKPRRDMVWVALAGPMSNFTMALMWAALLKLSLILKSHQLYAGTPLFEMSQIGVQINLLLMVLNLIPIPPLDGSRVVSSLLPPPYDGYFDKIGQFGFFIVLLLLWFGILTLILTPPMAFLHKALMTLFFIS